MHLKSGEILFAGFEAGCRDSSTNATRRRLGVFGSRVTPNGAGLPLFGGISEVIDRDRPESGNISFSGTLFPCEHTNFTITL
ncbi:MULTISPECIES: hypothetical protein [unclassified Microcoleus]|uniref:hypothetical protein n=1 Tax=unclassified Microcoleus TaxID=2642155 RepID=UPI002FD6CF0C